MYRYFQRTDSKITFRWMIKHFFKLKVQYVGVVPGKMYLKCSKWPTAWQKDISWREQMCQAYTEAILCTYCVIIKEKWKPAPRYNPSQAVCLHLMGCSPRPLPNTLCLVPTKQTQPWQPVALKDVPYLPYVPMLLCFLLRTHTGCFSLLAF